jgi:hypothetical protein
MPNAREISVDHQKESHTEDKLVSKLFGLFVVFVNSIPVTCNTLS